MAIVSLKPLFHPVHTGPCDAHRPHPVPVPRLPVPAEDDVFPLASPHVAEGGLRRLQLRAPLTLRARIAQELGLRVGA